MKRRIIIICVLIGLTLLQYFQFGDVYVSSNTVSSLLTFSSIIFGFYITSLAIFSTSSYVSGLYLKTNKKNPSETLLQTLLANYKTGLLWIFTSISYFIFLQLVFDQSKTEICKLTLKNIYLWPFLGIVMVNIWYSYKMLNDLIKVIMQEAKKPKR